MKKIAYVLILSLVVVSGLVFANRDINSDTAKNAVRGPLTAAEAEAERKKWEATPSGIEFKKWEASATGQKVLANAAKIRKHTEDSTSMEAVITSLSLPPGSQLGFGLMVKVGGEEYILSFGIEEAKEFQPLQDLKVGDKIWIKSGFVSYAPKYSFAIINGDFVEKDGKVLFKRIRGKNGC